MIATIILANLAPPPKRSIGTAPWRHPAACALLPRGAKSGNGSPESEELDPNSFTPADWSALEGAWAPLGVNAGRAEAEGAEGLVDDDLAFVNPWGFDVAIIESPALLIQGGEDRVVPRTHADWLLQHVRSSELWLRPRDGHISVLNAIPVALDWLRSRDELV